MKVGYFKRVMILTPTKMWINNVTPREARMAIDAGALGCTQNPSYVWRMLQAHREWTLPFLDDAIRESDDDNEVECILQRKLVGEIAKIFLPLFTASGQKHGYVSIQGDPVHEDDPNVIIEEGRKNRELGPNVMIKIPATAAGLAAMESLLAEGTPLNATEIMGVSQMVDVCEMYRTITRKTGREPIMYYSLITGIYDEWQKKEVARQGIDISPDILWHAGIAIAKKVYELAHDRGYTVRFIGGGVRDLHHFTEMVGGDVCITMNWEGAVDRLLELDQPVVSRLFNPVPQTIIDTLLEKVPGFKSAYMEHGLNAPDYEHFGPVMHFRGMFVSAWTKALAVISERRKRA